MEKGSQNIIKIVLTGPESTAKSSLSELLAEHFNTIYIPEFARNYIGQLNRKYNYSDVEYIARKQVEEYMLLTEANNNLVFFDTWLIITKIWFREVFKKYPDWIDLSLKDLKIDHYLLCSPDIDWKPDNLRENGGARREYLFRLYEEELKAIGASYSIINGLGKKRIENAILKVEKVIKI